jgi:hypothetical protein
MPKRGELTQVGHLALDIGDEELVPSKKDGHKLAIFINDDKATKSILHPSKPRAPSQGATVVPGAPAPARLGAPVPGAPVMLGGKKGYKEVDSWHKSKHDERAKPGESLLPAIAPLWSSESTKLAGQIEKVAARTGDYTMRVHLIEVRGIVAATDLIDSSELGLNSAFCTVEVMGNIETTRTFDQVNHCVFDHKCFFHFSDMSAEEISSETLDITLCDKIEGVEHLREGLFESKKVLGKFSLDLAKLYQNAGHEYHRQWVSFQDPKYGQQAR